MLCLSCVDAPVHSEGLMDDFLSVFMPVLHKYRRVSQNSPYLLSLSKNCGLIELSTQDDGNLCETHTSAWETLHGQTRCTYVWLLRCQSISYTRALVSTSNVNFLETVLAMILSLAARSQSAMPRSLLTLEHISSINHVRLITCTCVYIGV